MGRALQSPKELGISLPEPADKAIMHAMNMKPEERYVSIRSFEQDIEKAAADEKKAAGTAVNLPLQQVQQVPGVPQFWPQQPQAVLQQSFSPFPQQNPLQSAAASQNLWQHPYSAVPAQPAAASPKKNSSILRWAYRRIRRKLRKLFKK